MFAGRGGRLVACADRDIARAESLIQEADTKIFYDWRALLLLPHVDIVIIATLHDTLAEITREAIQAGKAVLVEKPAARSAQELEPIVALAEEQNAKVRVGFNHRYHRALRKAKEIINLGELGDLMFLCARYGHGGRLGYDQEWRANPALSGGGELIDQGVHLMISPAGF